MAICPFYGYRWPERASILQRAGSNECGLDFDANGPCEMEATGEAPNYFLCPAVRRLKPLLETRCGQIAFQKEQNDFITLEEWVSHPT